MEIFSPCHPERSQPIRLRIGRRSRRTPAPFRLATIASRGSFVKTPSVSSALWATRGYFDFALLRISAAGSDARSTPQFRLGRAPSLNMTDVMIRCSRSLDRSDKSCSLTCRTSSAAAHRIPPSAACARTAYAVARFAQSAFCADKEPVRGRLGRARPQVRHRG